MRHLLVLLAAAAVMPDLNQLKQMSARFAPVTLKYDAAALSAGDRKALPKLVEAARVLNHLFLDQLWSGNRELYAKLQQDTTPLGKARLHYFWLNKGPVERSRRPRRLRPRRARAQTAGSQFLSARHDPRGVRSLGQSAAGAGARTGHRILHRGPAQCEQATEPGPLQQGVRRRSGEGGGPLAGSRGAHRQRVAEEVPDAARRGLPLQRLLRERRRLDGPGRAARYHHRPLRDLQRRVVRLQGRVRSLHHHPRRSRNQQAQNRGRALAGSGEQPAAGPALPQSEAGRFGAHPRGERSLRFGRWRARRAHGGLQSAQRRARDFREGQRAHHAEEHSGSQVRQHPDPHRRARPDAGRAEKISASITSSPTFWRTNSATASARTRSRSRDAPPRRGRS